MQPPLQPPPLQIQDAGFIRSQGFIIRYSIIEAINQKKKLSSKTQRRQTRSETKNCGCGPTIFKCIRSTELFLGLLQVELSRHEFWVSTKFFLQKKPTKKTKKKTLMAD